MTMDLLVVQNLEQADQTWKKLITVILWIVDIYEFLFSFEKRVVNLCEFSFEKIVGNLHIVGLDFD